MTFIRKLGERLLGPPRPVESLVRNVLFLGFFVLLLLVAGVGYSGIQSIEQLEKESVLVSDIGERHFRLVLNLTETAGKIFPEARAVVANRPNSRLEFPARQRLNDLKKEMDGEVEQGRASTLVEMTEWKDFETAYKDFWAAMSETNSNAEGWHEQRGRMLEALERLDKAVDSEREQSNEKAHQMNLRARRGMAIATIAVLIVGVIVAGLAGYEIRRNLIQMASASSASSSLTWSLTPPNALLRCHAMPTLSSPARNARMPAASR